MCQVNLEIFTLYSEGEPFEKFAKRYAMRESILPYPNCLQHSGVSQLRDDFILVKELWTLCVVGFYASDKLRRTGHHSLQKVHQGVSEVRGNSLLSSRLRGQSATRVSLLLFATCETLKSK